jgi:hypothetical protein
MLLKTLAKFMKLGGTILMLIGVRYLIAHSLYFQGVSLLILGILVIFVLAPKLSEKAEADLSQMDIVSLFGDEQDYQAFKVVFGEPLLGKALVTRDQLGFMNEGTVRLYRDRVELFGNKGKHISAFVPLKLLGGIPLVGGIISGNVEDEFERKEIVCFSKFELKDLSRIKRKVTFLVPAEDHTNLRRSTLTAQTEQEAQAIENALKHYESGSETDHSKV